MITSCTDHSYLFVIITVVLLPYSFSLHPITHNIHYFMAKRALVAQTYLAASSSDSSNFGSPSSSWPPTIQMSSRLLLNGNSSSRLNSKCAVNRYRLFLVSIHFAGLHSTFWTSKDFHCYIATQNSLRCPDRQSTSPVKFVQIQKSRSNNGNPVTSVCESDYISCIGTSIALHTLCVVVHLKN